MHFTKKEKKFPRHRQFFDANNTIIHKYWIVSKRVDPNLGLKDSRACLPREGSSEMFKGYRGLIIRHNSYELRLNQYKATKRFPKDEL